MKRSAGFLCSLSVVLIVFMSWFGCGGGSSPLLSDPAPVSPILTKIGVSPSAASIQVGQQQKYAAIGYDQFNKPMAGITFRWSSNNAAIALIDDSGVAVGASQGSVSITASASDVRSAPASLNVLPPPSVLTTIAITPTASSLFVGGSQQFAAVGRDQYGNAMSGVAFTWSSSNASAATVNGAGLASGLSAGIAEITASAQGLNLDALNDA